MRVTLEGIQAQGTRQSESFQKQVSGVVGDWVLSHTTLGAGLLSSPHLTVGLVLKDGVEQRPRGSFRVEGRAILIVDVSLISSTILG